MRIIQNNPRTCEICGGNSFDILWEYERVTRTRKQDWLFHVTNCICNYCGFVFVSPAPLEQDLEEYYSESFSKFDGQELDYDANKRITAIESLVKEPESKVFAEIGSNARRHFAEWAEKNFKKCLFIEINTACDSDYVSLIELPESSVDVLCHYFVLEHIPQVRVFLQHCYRSLREGGLMFCEVPDLTLYGENPVALSLHEHVNHFTRDSLSQIAAQEGFVTINDIDKLPCSRSFGFTLAFYKPQEAFYPIICPQSIEKSRAYFESGLELIRKRHEQRQQAYKLILEVPKESPIIFWAANESLLGFIKHFPLPSNSVIVDSDPRKQHYIDGVDIHLPDNVKDTIVQSPLLVLFTKIHADAIQKSLRQKYGKVFEQVILLDFGGS